MRLKSKIIFAVFLLWPIVHLVATAVDGLSDNPTKADCILILGNTVNPDGTLSERLKCRVDKGLMLYQNHFAEKIIVSGGLGKEGYYEGTEMKKYLVKKGVTEANIIVDNKGVNTLETANSYLKISDQHNFKSVIVVSQYFHLSRTKLILKKKGVQKVYTAHANFFELRDLYSLPREFFAFYKYLLFL